MERIVAVDYIKDAIGHYAENYAVVAVDVIRATTTAITAVSMGRKCFPAPTIEAAVSIAAQLENPLLVGELGGNKPYGFDMNNSPAELAARTDISRPMVLLTTSGTKLICDAKTADAVYLACFRNYGAIARHLIGRHPRIALLGAATRGEFREEDQLCCAWIAAELFKAGYKPEDRRTEETVDRWSCAPLTACAEGKSAEYLTKTGQTKDLEFILTHVNDLDAEFMLQHDEVMRAATARSERAMPSSQCAITV
jgi:2-phosphosulfolactate phosphatase